MRSLPDNLDALLEDFILRAEPLGVRVYRAANAAEAEIFLAELAAVWEAAAAVVSAEVMLAAPDLVAALGRVPERRCQIELRDLEISSPTSEVLWDGAAAGSLMANPFFSPHVGPGSVQGGGGGRRPSRR